MALGATSVGSGAHPVVSALFLFNNRFERNVPVLEDLYRDRFSRRRYIMPFAKQLRPNVIPVREAGWFFSGHLAQAAERFIEPDVTHYVVISDDLYVNPALNERNLLDQLKLGPREAWIKSLALLDELRHRWEWSANGAFQARRMSITDLVHELPSPDEARARYARLGFGAARSPWPHSFKDLRYAFWTLPRSSRAIWVESLMMFGRPSPYPLLGGYADFLVVPAHAIDEFTRLCGVFAAMNQFAEVAVPTALALACDGIVTELDPGEHFRDLTTRERSRGPLKGMEFAGDEAGRFGEAHGWSMERLQTEFPADWLYAHPVKFSGWR